MNVSLTSRPAIRDAASVILLRRDTGNSPQVLMGMRNRKAVFMPAVYVFPGGAVDPEDSAPADGADPRLALAPCNGSCVSPSALLGCARRELEEETGLKLCPRSDFRFLFRAITPPGYPRRFDARFLVADAADIEGDPDDFSGAGDELSDLQWVSFPEARALNVHPITGVVLAEAEAFAAAAGDGPLPVRDAIPFMDHSGTERNFTRIT